MHAAPNPYDAVAYPSLPFPNTHPGRLAAMATLHGLNPAAVESCRVLEIACGDGANLIPMAYAIPGSEFVGFDLARLPVERAQARILSLGLKNVRIFQADVLEMQADVLEAGRELGEFDYIIAHGLYSWVPEPVREGLLALCGHLLAPEGIAFISYNALPGGYVRLAIREMMLHRSQSAEDVDRNIPAAMDGIRALLAARPEGDAYRVLLEEHLDTMTKRSPQAIFHDELSGEHHPVQFIDFCAHAARHGLKYMCEAVLPPPPDPCYKFDIRSAIEKAASGDHLRQEQMLDFVRARKYRETLLCRAERMVQREFLAENFRRVLFASSAVSSPGESSGSTIFTLPGGIKMEANHPVAITLMLALERAWPRALSFEELEPQLAATGFRLNTDGAALLTRLAVAKFLELRRWHAPVAHEIAQRPRASGCSRQEICHCPQATTLLHTTVRLDDPVARAFFALLDGTRDGGELAAALRAKFPELPVQDIDQQIEPSLEFFYRAGFLESE